MADKAEDNGANNTIDVVKKSQKSLIVIALWMLALVAALSVATYAWFTTTRYTNVTPTTYTVNSDDADLKIGTSETGPFGSDITLPTDGRLLHPISTADLNTFWVSTSQNPAGMSIDFANCTSKLSDYGYAGTLYLKAGADPLDVRLYKDGMQISSDVQLLASLRLGLVVSKTNGQSSAHIFKLDDLGSTTSATSRATVAQDNVVVGAQGNSWGFVADPAESINGYAMDAGANGPVARDGSKPLVSLAANEVATVRYYLYMEGCDPNSFNDAQSQNISLRFAFGATKA